MIEKVLFSFCDRIVWNARRMASVNLMARTTVPYSYLKASTGSSRAALVAG
jgi:hypothetical protein